MWITLEIMWLLWSIFTTQIHGYRIGASWNILGIWRFCFLKVWVHEELAILGNMRDPVLICFACMLVQPTSTRSRCADRKERDAFLFLAVEAQQIKSRSASCLSPLDCRQTKWVTFCSSVCRVQTATCFKFTPRSLRWLKCALCSRWFD